MSTAATTNPTPHPYGWNPTAEHIARVRAEEVRRDEQRAARRAEKKAVVR